MQWIIGINMTVLWAYRKWITFQSILSQYNICVTYYTVVFNCWGLVYVVPWEWFHVYVEGEMFSFVHRMGLTWSGACLHFALL